MSDSRKTNNQPDSVLKSVSSNSKSGQSSPNGASNRLAVKSAKRQQSALSPNLIIERANQNSSKQVDEVETGPDRAIASTSLSGSSPQLRSTLAIGQLIASNRPTAGSRLIASELRHLSNSIQEESASIRAEIASLSTTLAGSLKSVMEEDREQRTLVAGNALARRPMITHFRRFPLLRRRHVSVGTNTSASNSPTPITSPSTSNPASKSSTNNANTLKQASIKSMGTANARKTFTLFKNPWLPDERSGYDSESDTESTDTAPSSTP